MPSLDSRAAMRFLRRCGFILASLWLVPTSGSAQVSFSEETYNNIHFETTCIMPNALRPGLLPVHILIENRGDQVRHLELHLGSQSRWDVSADTTGTLRLEPGEKRGLDWLTAFVDRGSFGQTSLIIKEKGQFLGSIRVHQIDSGSATKNAAPVLAASSSPKEFAETFNLLKHQKLLTRASGCEIHELPTDWRAYSTLAIVALDLDSPPPNGDQLDAILNWVSLGGTLIMKGSRAQAAQLLAQQGSLLEKRFQISAPSENEPRQRLVYRHMFGRIALSPASQELLPLELVTGPGWNVPADMMADDLPPDGPFAQSLRTFPLRIPGVNAAPVSGLTGLLILFAVLIGPAQFYLLKRRAAPPFRFLLVTPLLGFGFALLIVMYSLFSQGLDVKESILSVTWLDQRSHDVATMAQRTTFSGSIFRNQLRYTGRTAALPAYAGRSGRQMNEYRINMDAGGALESAYLPVRVPTTQMIATQSKERSRIEFETDGDRIFAINGFDVDLASPSAELSALVYRDAQGNYFKLPTGQTLRAHQRLEMPASTSLPGLELPLPVQSQPRKSSFNLVIAEKDSASSLMLDHFPQVLPLRSYRAFLAQSPFVEDGGIERQTSEQRHMLFGTLPELGR